MQIPCDGTGENNHCAVSLQLQREKKRGKEGGKNQKMTAGLRDHHEKEYLGNGFSWLLNSKMCMQEKKISKE